MLAPVAARMPFDPERVETVTFDSYSTLVDVGAARERLAAHVENPTLVAGRWRARALAYTFVTDALDDYRPFSELLATALDHALATVGADVSAEARAAILETYDDPTVFPDVPDGIDRLAAAGNDPHVVSNGDPAMLEELVAAAGIEDCVDCVSADEIEAYKPGPAIYRHAAARTGTPIDRIVHVSAAWFDVLGARNAGMQAVWLDRDARPWDPFGQPDATVESIHELADRLGA